MILLLWQDERDKKNIVAYRELIGYKFFKCKIGNVFTRTLKLYDPLINKYRWQKVFLQIKAIKDYVAKVVII